MKKSKLFRNSVLLFLIILCSYGFAKWYLHPGMYQSKQITLWNKRTEQVENRFHDGDIIFQTTHSRQCKAVQLATHSIYSHCGIIFKTGNEYYVYEALQPVQITPVKEWIERGDEEHYVVRRLKNADEALTAEAIEKMKHIAETFVGKDYDILFGWSDDKIYCSELVWKIYQRATGLEVGKLEKLKDFDLSDKSVKKILEERYGDRIPYNETVVSPADIFNSDLLTTIESN